MAGIALLCINPGITQGEDNKNLLLCAAMCLSPAVLLLKGTRVIIRRVDLPLLAVCVLSVICPPLFHPESVRWITVLFTCAYCVYFMMLARVLRISSFTPQLLVRTIRWIIYAFAAVLVIQQFCVLTGLPVFMSAMVYPRYPWKLNSLTAEPSHTTVTLCMAMFTFTQTCRAINPGESLRNNIRKNPMTWLCWAYTTFITYNASAFILAPLAFIPYITKRNITIWVAAAAIVLAAVHLTPLRNYWQLQRIMWTAKALVTFDEQAIIDADDSAAMRIVPSIYGIKALARSSAAELAVGHGTDADQHDLPPRPCDEKQRGFAGVFCMAYNYGLPCALAFWTAIGMVTLTRRRWTSIITFLFALQLSADYNMQLVWMIMAFGMMFKYTVCGSHRLLDTVLSKRNGHTHQTSI